MRNVVRDIWQDEFTMSLNHFERLLWLGMIVSLADDQGRFVINLLTIKVMIFANDKVTNKQIEQAINEFAKVKRILVYTPNDKKVAQIMNWWKYQSAAEWMGISKLPPPKNWEDFYRYNDKGQTQTVSDNWQRRKEPRGSQVVTISKPRGKKVKDNEKEKEKKNRGMVKKHTKPEGGARNRKSPPTLPANFGKGEPKGFANLRKGNKHGD